MPRQERDTNVKSVLVQVPSQICERLRSVTEPVQEKNRLGVSGAQVDRTRAGNYVFYGTWIEFRAASLLEPTQ